MSDISDQVSNIASAIKKIAEEGFEDCDERRAIVGGCDLLFMLSFKIRVVVSDE
jgi:hypothetical protein